jgi:hypothetical protein
MVPAEDSAWKKCIDAVPDFADDAVPREILRFFKKHARTRFNKSAIFHALTLERPKAFLDKALRGLVEQGMVVEYVKNGVELYSLKKS